MKHETKLLLLKYDERGAYEFPNEFNYDVLENMAKMVDKNLHDNGINTSFEGAVHNQDASFSVAIILIDFKTMANDEIQLPTIRFSNFGFMSTLTFMDLLPNEINDKIIKIIISGGFKFIPCDEMDEAYDGVMDDKKTFSTWWVRYFDWL